MSTEDQAIVPIPTENSISGAGVINNDTSTIVSGNTLSSNDTKDQLETKSHKPKKSKWGLTSLIMKSPKSNKPRINTSETANTLQSTVHESSLQSTANVSVENVEENSTTDDNPLQLPPELNTLNSMSSTGHTNLDEQSLSAVNVSPTALKSQSSKQGSKFTRPTPASISTAIDQLQNSPRSDVNSPTSHSRMASSARLLTSPRTPKQEASLLQSVLSVDPGFLPVVEGWLYKKSGMTGSNIHTGGKGSAMMQGRRKWKQKYFIVKYFSESAQEPFALLCKNDEYSERVKAEISLENAEIVVKEEATLIFNGVEVAPGMLPSHGMRKKAKSYKYNNYEDSDEDESDDDEEEEPMEVWEFSIHLRDGRILELYSPDISIRSAWIESLTALLVAQKRRHLVLHQSIRGKIIDIAYPEGVPAHVGHLKVVKRNSNGDLQGTQEPNDSDDDSLSQDSDESDIESDEDTEKEETEIEFSQRMENIYHMLLQKYALNYEAYGSGLIGVQAGIKSEIFVQAPDDEIHALLKQEMGGDIEFTVRLESNNTLYMPAMSLVDPETVDENEMENYYNSNTENEAISGRRGKRNNKKSKKSKGFFGMFKSSKSKLKVEDIYRTEFNISKPGDYTLSICIGDDYPILGSPFKINVTPGPTSVSHVVVKGDGLNVIRPRELSYFTITSKDAFGNIQQTGGDPFEVTVTGPAALKGLRDNGNGTYSCAFEAKLIPEMLQLARDFNQLNGPIRIQISLNGLQVPGSPFFPRIDLTEDHTLPPPSDHNFSHSSSKPVLNENLDPPAKHINSPQRQKKQVGHGKVGHNLINKSPKHHTHKSRQDWDNSFTKGQLLNRSTQDDSTETSNDSSTNQRIYNKPPLPFSHNKDSDPFMNPPNMKEKKKIPKNKIKNDQSIPKAEDEISPLESSSKTLEKGTSSGAKSNPSLDKVSLPPPKENFSKFSIGNLVKKDNKSTLQNLKKDSKTATARNSGPKKETKKESMKESEPLPMQGPNSDRVKRSLDQRQQNLKEQFKKLEDAKKYDTTSSLNPDERSDDSKNSNDRQKEGFDAIHEGSSSIEANTDKIFDEVQKAIPLVVASEELSKDRALLTVLEDKSLREVFMPHAVLLMEIFEYYANPPSTNSKIALLTLLPAETGSAYTQSYAHKGLIRMAEDYDIIPNFLSKREVKEVMDSLLRATGSKTEGVGARGFLDLLITLAIHTLSKEPFSSMYTTNSSKINMLLTNLKFGDQKKLTSVKNKAFNKKK